LVVSSSEVVRIPARKVKVADTVGAGDAFAAAMLAGLCLGFPAGRAARHAAKVAAAVCGKRGATPVLAAFLRLR
jgi:fructokinase